MSLPAGVVGNAFNFDGSAVIEVPYSLDLVPSGGLTIEAWVRPVGFQPSYARVVGLQTDFSYNSSWVFGLGVRGGIYFGAFRAGNQAFIDGTSALPSSTWTHVAGTWDGTLMRAYVDGIVQPDVAAITGPLGGMAVPLRIGRGNTLQLGFRGQVDELTLYDRALTPAELARIVSARHLGKCKVP